MSARGKNSPPPEISVRQAFAQLRKTDTALVGKVKNQPVIVFRHGRWHMLGIGFVTGPKMGAKRGIGTVHFLSLYRARKTIKEWLPYSKLASYEGVCPAFREELIAKVLVSAEDYRLLLQKKQVVLAGGFTTDTLLSFSTERYTDDTLVARIAEMMREGQAGPFLHFERTYQVIQAHAA